MGPEECLSDFRPESFLPNGRRSVRRELTTMLKPRNVESSGQVLRSSRHSTIFSVKNVYNALGRSDSVVIKKVLN